MTTKLVGSKDFRNNFRAYKEEANEKNTRFIVLDRNVPVLEVTPLHGKKNGKKIPEKLAREIKEIAEARASNKTYTQEEVMKEFGIT